MKLSDLKTGMWIEYRNGEKRIVVRGTEHGDILTSPVDRCGWTSFTNMDKDLTHCSISREFDIVRVYNVCDSPGMVIERSGSLRWERTEDITVTIQDTEVKLSQESAKALHKALGEAIE